MDCKDLMIGDWVICNDLKRQVAAIGETVGFLDCNNQVYWAYEGFDRIDPIPLTGEILVKNGFSEIHHPGTGATDEYSEWFFGGIKIIEWLEDWKYHYFSAGGDGAPIDFQYVHQLQHLLRLVGVQKEFEL